MGMAGWNHLPLTACLEVGGCPRPLLQAAGGGRDEASVPPTVVPKPCDVGPEA